MDTFFQLLLAAEDFKVLRRARARDPSSMDIIGLLYLLSKFWASIESIRHKVLTVSVTLDNRGRKLGHFYLAFVGNPEKYLGPPKRRPQNERRRREETLALRKEERNICRAAFIRLGRFNEPTALLVM